MTKEKIKVADVHGLATNEITITVTEKEAKYLEELLDEKQYDLIDEYDGDAEEWNDDYSGKYMMLVSMLGKLKRVLENYLVRRLIDLNKEH